MENKPIHCLSWGGLAFLIEAISKSEGAEDVYGFVTLISIGSGSGVALIFAWIAWSLGRKLRPFVHMAEEIFRGFGWQDVERIDLYKLSRRNRKPDDPVELGAFYHRY